MWKEKRLTSLMLKEARSAADYVAVQLTRDQDRYAALGAQLRATPPASIVTVARGSSIMRPPIAPISSWRAWAASWPRCRCRW
jgi:hypothetical protein